QVAINYLYGSIITMLILFLVLIYERGISDNIRDKLKDDYSHTLGNQTQILLGAVNILEKICPKENIETEKIIQQMKKVTINAGELIQEIRSL
ncbi:MAG: hypothetical protein ACTSPV_18320, partial [Candidatus Hodarchaeales archaeon]